MPRPTPHRSKYHPVRAPVIRPVPSPASKSKHRIFPQNTIKSQQTNLEEMQRLQMRWIFFWVCIAFCTLWMIATITASIIVFCITRNFLSFFISAGIALPVEFMRRFANYLLPMDEKRFLLAKIKMDMKVQNSSRAE